MRLPLPTSTVLLLALACAAGAGAAAEGTVTYRCPNNDYKNTISAKEAEKLGCKKLEGAPVTVIQMTKPRQQGTAVPAAAASGAAGSIRRRSARATAMPVASSRTSCRTEEERLAALKKEYNNGQPERQGNEQNYQKYVDRVGQLQRRDRPQGSRHRRHPARAPEAAGRPRPAVVTAAGPPGAPAPRADDAAGYAALDLLATMVAVVTPEGECIFANSSFENALGLSRRSMSRGSAFDWFADAAGAARHGRGGQQQRLRHQPARRAAEAPGRDPWRDAAGAGDRQPDRRLAQRRLRDRRDRAADAPGARGARPRAGAGDQGADPQSRPRDQEPARRHPRRRPAARDGDRVARA